MSDAFDPYRKWLGIPAGEQPPNHYRLLAIDLFEDDPDVIEAAADQRMAHVRNYQTGPRSALSQRILNELAAAKLCLLNAEEKVAYDGDLRRRIDLAQPKVPQVPRAQPVAPNLFPPSFPVAELIDPTPQFVTGSRRTQAKRKSLSRMPPNAAGWLAFVVVALAAAAIVAHLISTRHDLRVAVPPPPHLGKQQTSERSQAKPKPGPSRKPPKELMNYGRKSAALSGTDAVDQARMAKRFAFEMPDMRRARWSLEGGDLVQSAPERNINIVFGDAGWQDIEFSIEAQRTAGDDMCGIVFAYQDARNMRLLTLAGQGNKTHSVHSIEDANWRELASRGGSLDIGKWYSVKLRLSGNAGQCFLDDAPILSFQTAVPAHGRVGLRTSGSVYRFRNLVIKAPDGRVLLEGLPALDDERPLRAFESERSKTLASRGGSLPKAADGRPLNFDFERGDLQDWTAEGDAFAGQPACGDTLHAKYKYLCSQHTGRFWIAGSDRPDSAGGTLTSVPFKVTHPYATFLMAGGGLIPSGGAVNEASVELVLCEGNKAFFTCVGHGSDTLYPVTVNLSEHLGKDIFIRIADHSGSARGRVSFDDFRFHEKEPNLSWGYITTAALPAGTTTNVLELIDIERDSRGGEWHWDRQHRLAAEGWCIIQLPVAIPTEYDLAMTLEAHPMAGEVALWLPIGGRQVIAMIDGDHPNMSGLNVIDGKAAAANDSTHRGAVLLPGQQNNVLCQVRLRSLRVMCNGATVINWEGDPVRLSLPGNKHVAGADRMLVSGRGDSWSISQLELTPVGGPAVVPQNVKANAPVNPVATSDTRRSLADLAKEQTPARQTGLIAKELATLKQHTGAVTRVAFHPTLSVPLLASAGKDGRVLLWNLQTRTLQSELHQFPNTEVWALAFSQKTGVVAFANRDHWGSKLLMKTIEGQRVRIIDDFKKSGGGAVASIAISSDEQMLAAGQDDGTLRVWHISSPNEIGSIGLGDRHNIHALSFGLPTVDARRKRSSYPLAAGGLDGQVRTFSAMFDQNNRTAALAQTNVQFPKSGPVQDVKFAPRGDMLGCTRWGGRVTLYNPLTGQEIRELATTQPGNHAVEWIAFHLSRPWCITAHKDASSARIWNIETGELLCELKGHTGGVLCAAFSPAGNTVATASEDFSIKLWTIYDPNAPAPVKRGRRR